MTIIRDLFGKCHPLQKILLGGWLVIIALAPFHAFLSTWGGSTGGLLVWKSWKEIILVLILFVGCVELIRQKKFAAFCRDRLVQAVFAYVLLHLLLWALARPETQPAIAGLLMNLRVVGMLLLGMMVAQFVDRRQLLTLTLHVLLGGAAAVVLFALLQITVLPADFLTHFGYSAATIAPYTTLDNNPDVIRAMSTLRGPNPLGEYLIIVALLLAGLHGRYNKWLLIACMVLVAVVLYATYSRSAWIGAIAGVGAFGWLHIKDALLRKRLFVASLTLFVVGVAAVAILLPQSPALQSVILHNQHGDTDIGSTAAHAQASADSAKRIWSHPWGSGPGAAGPASFYGSTPQIPENYYLQLAEEIGIGGLLLFVAICVMVVLRLWPHRREWWPAFLLASFVGISVINLFLHGWADDTTALIWWGLAGLFCAQE